MLRYFSILVIFAMAMATSIHAVSVLETNIATAINGSFDCGSGSLTGTLIQLDIEDCTQIPCKVCQRSTYKMSITFRPAASTNFLTLNVLFGILNEETGRYEYQALKLQPLPGTFIAGHQYRVSTDVPIPRSLAGKTGHVAFPLYQGPSDTIESRHMCRYVPTNVVH